jgi:hypothetical protein
MDLPEGIHRTRDGHLRYSSPKEKRGKYVHRDVVEQRIAEMAILSVCSCLPVRGASHGLPERA